MTVDDVEVAGEALATADAVLGAVEGALARLEAGSYGLCETCGVEIDEAVLAEEPAATTCVLHRGPEPD